MPKRLGSKTSSAIIRRGPSRRTAQTYCLEHPAAGAKIPPGSLRERGACQTQYGGVCDADAHETDRVLIWGPLTPMAGDLLNRTREPGRRLESADGPTCIHQRLGPAVRTLAAHLLEGALWPISVKTV
jgi:hypothetical protein